MDDTYISWFAIDRSYSSKLKALKEGYFMYHNVKCEA